MQKKGCHPSHMKGRVKCEQTCMHRTLSLNFRAHLLDMNLYGD